MPALFVPARFVAVGCDVYASAVVEGAAAGVAVEPGRLIFVGGLHRSGTTPLARLLAAHPEISGLSGTGVFEDEGAHLQDVLPAPRSLGGMGRFAHSPRAHLTAASELATPQTAESLLAAWIPFWDTGRRLLVEKSPGNMLMGGLLQEIFPGSALIVVVRHPVAVAMAMQKWNPAIVARDGRWHQTLPGYVRHWERAHELVELDAPGIRRLLVLRYEDLVRDPRRELDRIEGFLGLDSPIDAGGVRGGLGDDYQHRWDAMRTGAPWHRLARAAVLRRSAATMRRWGYDPGTVTGAGAPTGIEVLSR